MEHLIAHRLDIPTAKKVTDRAFAEYKARFVQYDPTLRWVSDRRAEISFQAAGVALNGAMQIAENEIALELDVPFLLRPFKKKAIEIIDREVKRWIVEAEAGKL
jgi:hypothetical protein